jgi:membrane protease YdiL (CAAX protease family)
VSRPFPRDIRWDQRDVALAFGTALAIFIGSTLLLVLLFGGDESDDFLKDETFGGVPVGLWIVAVQQIIFVFAAWRFSVSKYRLDVRVLGFLRAEGRLPYLLAFGGWILTLFAIVFWQLIIDSLGIDALTPEDNVDEVIDFGGNLITTLLVVGIWGPVAEEIFFRGFALAGLRRRFGDRTALILTAALFAVFHIEPTIYVPIFFFGIVLGWIYLRTNSLWPSIFIHVIHNTVILSITILAD